MHNADSIFFMPQHACFFCKNFQGNEDKSEWKCSQYKIVFYMEEADGYYTRDEDLHSVYIDECFEPKQEQWCFEK